MFKLHRQHNGSSPKSGERVDFKFSNFQALQVPKGWDKLFLAVISVDTGKTIAKLGKATVRNGNCQWTETILESVWISKDDSSHELEECLFKFVVSMGSSRAGILGEAIINFSSFMNSRSSSPVLCPLAKCSYGTLFQVKIQCLTVMSPLRKENSNHSGSYENNQAADYHDTGHKPSRFVDTFANGVRTSHSQKSDITSQQGGYDSKESSNSESVSSKASRNTDPSSVRRGLNSHHSLPSDGFSPNQRHVGSTSPLPPPPHLVARHSLSSQSSYQDMSPRMELRSSGKESSVRNGGGSGNLLEAAEKTIDELRAEAKMWERNARKLMLDLELLRKEFLDQSKKQADAAMELSASHTERDALKKQIEDLKATLEEVSGKQKAFENSSSFQYGSHSHIQKELESEIKFHNETNANLASQLQRSQESNIELLSVLQELEETIEQQKVEIQTIKEGQMKLPEKTLQNGTQNTADYAGDVHLVKELDSLREKVEELERDCNELTDENLELALKLKDLKDTRIEKFSSFSSTSSELPSKSTSAMSELSDHEPVYDQETKRKLNEEEAFEFVFEVLKQIEVTLQHLLKPLFGTSSDVTEKCKYLLADLVNIRRKDMPTYNSKALNESALKCFFEVNKIVEDRIAEYEWGFKYDELETQKRDATIFEAEKNLKDLIQKIEEQEQSRLKLEADRSNLLNECTQQRYKIDEFEAILLSKDDEIENLSDQISELEKQNGHMEENRVLVNVESDVTAKCLNEVRDELATLKNSLETSVSAKEILEKNVSYLEMERISLERDLLQLKEEYESCQIELQKSESHSMNLQAQIDDMEIEMESDTKNLVSELKSAQEQLLAAQIEGEHVQTENRNFEESNLRLNEECRILQKLNEELKTTEMELRKQCTILETKLEETEETFLACSEKMEYLEKKLAYMVDDFSLQEKNLTSELETLFRENENVKEKLVEQESLQLETSAEIKNLQSEIDGFRQNNALLTSEHEKLLKQLGNEEKLTAAVNDLELKLTVSDYENQQLREENADKKNHLKITSDLQDEISRLKSRIDECKSEKDKLEDSLRCISADYEVLKHEKDSCVEKLTSLEQSILDHESCQKTQAFLEAKVQKLEDALLLKETNAEDGSNFAFDMSKPQISRHSSEVNNDSQTSDSEELHRDSNRVTQETSERSKSSLETELKDLSERYLQMSLKYAEVEAQREDLVMKLKATKGGGRLWF